jgi:hypothetical protein
MSGAFGAVLATSALSLLTVIFAGSLTIRGVSERGSLLFDLPRAEAQLDRCASALGRSATVSLRFREARFRAGAAGPDGCLAWPSATLTPLLLGRDQAEVRPQSFETDDLRAPCVAGSSLLESREGGAHRLAAPDARSRATRKHDCIGRHTRSHPSRGRLRAVRTLRGQIACAQSIPNARRRNAIAWAIAARAALVLLSGLSIMKSWWMPS